MKQPPSNPTRQDEGAALLTAIFYTLIIALLAASIITTQHLRSLSKARQADRVQAELLTKTAETFGILLVTGRLAHNSQTATNANDMLSAPARCTLAEGVFELVIEDEAGKVDLNTGPLSHTGALMEEIHRPDIAERVREFRGDGVLISNINELLGDTEEDVELRDVLDRTVTVFSRLPGVDRSKISSAIHALPLRLALERLPGGAIRSPQRVFRFDISVRVKGGLEYGRTSYVRLARGAQEHVFLRRQQTPPVFHEDEESLASADLCRTISEQG